MPVQQGIVEEARYRSTVKQNQKQNSIQIYLNHIDLNLNQLYDLGQNLPLSASQSTVVKTIVSVNWCSDYGE